MSMVLPPSDHSKNEACDDGTADQDDEVGGKERHNKFEGIVHVVRSHKQMDPKQEKKATCQGQGNQSYPPEGSRHEILRPPRQKKPQVHLPHHSSRAQGPRSTPIPVYPHRVLFRVRLIEDAKSRKDEVVTGCVGVHLT
jgi:hypothetical protein